MSDTHGLPNSGGPAPTAPEESSWLADIALLGVCAIWGGTFFMVQTAVDQAAVQPFLALRFGLAAVVLALPWAGRMRGLTTTEATGGIGLGLMLAAGYSFQTFGLRQTDSTKAAFLTGVAVVLVPVLSVLRGRWPPTMAVVGVAVAAVGLVLVSLRAEMPSARLADSPALLGPLGMGELLMLGCAASFAGHILGQGELAPRCDPLRLVAVQVAATAVFSAMGWALANDEGLSPQHYGAEIWWAVVFLAVAATALALVIQAWAQRRTSPTHTAVILASEPVFGAVFGVFIAGEILTPANWGGCALIVTGIIAAEWPPPQRDP